MTNNTKQSFKLSAWCRGNKNEKGEGEAIEIELRTQPFNAGDFQFTLHLSPSDNTKVVFGCEVARSIGETLQKVKQGRMVFALLPTTLGIELAIWGTKIGTLYETSPLQIGIQVWSEEQTSVHFLSNEDALKLADHLLEAANAEFPTMGDLPVLDGRPRQKLSVVCNQSGDNVVEFGKPKPVQAL
jgi:hypothetical protein